MPANNSRALAPIALRRASPRAAPRRPFHDRGDRDRSLTPRAAAGDRQHPGREFRTHAEAISAGAERAAVACTETAAKAGFSPPQTGVSVVGAAPTLLGQSLRSPRECRRV